MEAVAEVILRDNPDIVNLVEVEGIDALNRFNQGFLEGQAYTAHLIKGKDSATGQDVALLTRIDPDEAIARDDRRNDFDGDTDSRDVNNNTPNTLVLSTIKEMDPDDDMDDLTNVASFVPQANRFTTLFGGGNCAIPTGHRLTQRCSTEERGARSVILKSPFPPRPSPSEWEKGGLGERGKGRKKTFVLHTPSLPLLVSPSLSPSPTLSNSDDAHSGS